MNAEKSMLQLSADTPVSLMRKTVSQNLIEYDLGHESFKNSKLKFSGDNVFFK